MDMYTDGQTWICTDMDIYTDAQTWIYTQMNRDGKVWQLNGEHI